MTRPKTATEDAGVPYSTPYDAVGEPSRLLARVVDQGPPSRVHGYDVEGDLARHYGVIDLFALMLGGELASKESARALEIALVFLSPVSVAEGPSHAAVLSRVCGVPFSATLSVASLALAEEATSVLAEHEDWLAWLALPVEQRGPPPARHLESDHDNCTVDRLRERLDEIPYSVAALACRPRRVAAVLAVLVACGLTREAIQTAWVWARLPSVAAEAAARGLQALREYPFNLPPLDYREAKK